MAAGGRLEDGSLDILQSTDDDPLLDTQPLPQHSLHAHFRPRFYPLPTVIIANLLLLIHVVFVILAFLTGVLCLYPNPNEDKCPEKYTNPLKVQTVIILGKIVLWILHLLLERYIQYHHSKVRSRGYSQIYRSTRHLKTLALMIHSSVRIRRFNRAKPQPDVLEEEKNYAHPRNIASETGFRTMSSLEEIVEKQGDIIAYLKRHNALLSKRLLDLACQPART
ncbi:transmembrane protein 192 isoform X2 [Cricetulus griseus]|uniref:Transmembrane protein 192 n=2 Tax=Cricetulus griseus TaxID=10029 RepID=A0A9J7F7X9_CRIGR|nr:transmembrane protein 192 isoform X5 [Cricetulus griseus]XP_035310057.1 transmembrane protein 192 isoform X2 [Cricetulus griseus]ERE92336.1 transmembrane protein [Cricetulus griseus]